MSDKRSGKTRREFLRDVSLGAGAAALLPGFLGGCARAVQTAGVTSTLKKGWDSVPQILARMVPSDFPARDFDARQYGAVGDGVKDCSAAFAAAIAACHSAGGGRVTVPPGKYLSGPIHLKSNVNLHVEQDATILFSTDPKRYLPQVLTRFEGVELMGLSPLIYAIDCENVAVTGGGTLDGQASNEHWWPWKGKTDFGWKKGTPNGEGSRLRLFEMAEKGVPVAERVFGVEDCLRPSFIQFYRCKNVLIGRGGRSGKDGLTILRSPMWEINPVLCTNVTVRAVQISTHGPNNDGCDPESCRDVLIENCMFDTGDDCIAIKSGRNADGRRLATPSENIIVRGCEMRDGHGGVTIGSEISGGVCNVFVEKCTMNSPRLDIALRFKNNAARGGLLEHVYMRDVTVGEVANAVLSIDFFYEEGPKGSFVPVVRDVEMLRVTSKKSKYGVYIRGFEGATIDDIRVADCTFDGVTNGNVIEHATHVDLAGTRVNGVLNNRAA
jgi:polygalacturonase